MADEIKVGDVVRLKSGGPKMTVQGDIYGNCLCAWFVKDKEQTGQFSPASLELVHEDD